LGSEPSVRVDGLTIWLVQEIYASPINDREEVAHALKLSELGQYVAENYNSNSLSAYVREVAREVAARFAKEEHMYDAEDVRAALPEPLGKTLKLSFVHKLSTRKV